MHSYNFDYIKRLPIKAAVKLLSDAFKAKNEDIKLEKTWQMWVSLYPDMIRPNPYTGEPLLNFITFKEFYDKHSQTTPDNRMTNEEIVEKFEKIKLKDQGRASK